MISIFDSESNYFDDASLYEGAIGVELVFETRCDEVQNATRLELVVSIPTDDPDIETPVSWDGEAFEETKIRYVTKAGDLPVSGNYRIYAVIYTPTKEIPGETAIVRVKRRGE